MPWSTTHPPAGEPGRFPGFQRRGREALPGCRPWAVLGLLLLAGCPPPAGRPGIRDEPLDDSPLSRVVARVNANAAAMDFLLRAGGVEATGEYRRGGVRERFQLRGVLLFKRPRFLYLKLDHLGPAVEAGSNDEEFWFWEKVEARRYLWGRHACMGDDFEAEIPLRPDLLADILGLGDLPAEGEAGRRVLMVKQADHYELLLQGEDAARQAYITKRVEVDRRHPCLVRGMTFLRRDGQPMVRAQLSDYRAIEGTTVLVPRDISITWLPDRGHVRITLDTVTRFDQPAAMERFISPRERGILGDSEIVRVDRGPEGCSPAPDASGSTPPLTIDLPADAVHGLSPSDTDPSATPEEP